MWNPYSANDMAATFVICTSAMNLWTSVVPHIFFELVELHYLDNVVQQFGFK